MSFGKFDTYYDKANKAKKSGDFVTAKKFLLLAGRSLLETALESEGETKAALVNRAQMVEKYAESLPVTVPLAAPSKESNAATTKPKPEHVPAPQKSLDDEGIEFLPAEVPNISFDDVAGLEGVKETIRTSVIYPSQHPDVYERFKQEPGAGVLMYGPPGTGKTMIAKATAYELSIAFQRPVKFYSIRCSDIVNKWVGEAEKRVKVLFDTARQEEIAAIFFDEFESLASKRDYSPKYMQKLVTEFLSQMDGFSGSKNTLLLIAATNRPWDIDSAFLRHKRFGIQIYIPLPDVEARKHIITKELDGVPLEDGINFYELASRMEGFNGADVAGFCSMSRIHAIKRSIANGGNANDQVVTKEDIEKTLEHFYPSVQKEDLDKLEKYKKQYESLK